MVKNLLFDLDGTLTDSGIGIKSSVAYSLRKLGHEALDDDTLKKFIGPPLDYSYMNYANMDKEEAIEAVKAYREYYSEKGIFENKVYDGVKEALDELADYGISLSVATSKPEIYTNKILLHFGLSGYFNSVVGSYLDGTRKEKDKVIKHVFKISDYEKRDTLMVGDREHDIAGAHKNGIECIAVLYGYGDLDEFRRNNADYIAETPKDILRIVKKINGD